jgi:hypothetical protein
VEDMFERMRDVLRCPDSIDDVFDFAMWVQGEVTQGGQPKLLEVVPTRSKWHSWDARTAVLA